ncbi:hypothetical protein [Streptomyces niveus]|uniref:hypothetical protein n=1 Tax=Streptomyces niveus TaxID=193462 RepID=UPI003683AD3F
MESTNTPRPSPLVMAARQPRPASGRSGTARALPVAPPPARPGPWIRAEWETAITHSDLHPFARLTALVLARYAAHHSGVIGAAGGEVPSVGRIATATALEADRAGTSLRVLEALGWLHREDATVGPRRRRTERPMRLTIPVTAYVPPVRARPDRTADSHTGGHDHHAP